MFVVFAELGHDGQAVLIPDVSHPLLSFISF